MKIAKILRWYDAKGNYIGPEDRMVHMKEGSYPLQEYADLHGIELPDSKVKKEKKTKNEVNSYADMGQTFDEGSPEIDGDGDSQGEE